MKEHFLSLPDEMATLKLGAALAAAHHCAIVITLVGCLGSGKTTFSRGFIQALGYTGKVKSPTYTLVESYSLLSGTIYHFDLYRLSDPQELESIGLRDYFNEHATCLIEWPEKGEGVLPQADLDVHFIYQGQKRDVHLIAYSAEGIDSLERMLMEYSDEI